MNDLGYTPRSILIIKTSAIGDVIQAFPVLEYLKRKFPHAQIDWVVEQTMAPLLQAHPLLDHVIRIPMKAWRQSPLSKKTFVEIVAFVKELRAIDYDLAVDLQGNTKSAFITAIAKAKYKLGFGWKSVREKTNLLATNQRLNVPANLNVRMKYLHLVQGYFKDFSAFQSDGIHLRITPSEQERLKVIRGENPQLMVCFGSRWMNKRLKYTTLQHLLQRIAESYTFSFLFIFGDEEEKKIADRLADSFGQRGKSIGNVSLPLWQALMWEVDGVIAVDSAALHLCGTTQTASFSIFGPSLASYYKPTENRHAAVQGACPYGRKFTSRCPILRTCSTGACLSQLRVEDLFAAFQQWVKRVE